ncbi:fimbrial protein [Morganella morganii]|uniref:fimbrial protein n=1 Tax=Morganella morganii TaxID=582 RepID=UPI0021A2FAEE
MNTTGETGTATGVGIQLLYDSQPLTLGTDVPVGSSSAGGSFSVPLQARYYQTGNTITTGKANAVLTFTMTYQ